MKTILFIHDTSTSLLRGAELTITQLVTYGKQLGFSVYIDTLNNFEQTKTNINSADIIVVNSTSRCNYEIDLLNFIIDSQKKYIKIEFDYNFCVRRNVLCLLDYSIRNCCNTDKYHLYRNLFSNSWLNFFQSPKHYEYHYQFYGDAVKNHIVMPPTVDVDNLKKSDEKSDEIPFFGELNYLKGGNDFVNYAIDNKNKTFVVYGENKLRCEIPKNICFKPSVSNIKVLEILSKTKEIFIKPVWPEPSGRLAAEAFLSGCHLITNDRVGTWSFSFYPNNLEKAIQEIKNTIPSFWNKIQSILNVSKKEPSEKLKNVLVLKSYGGLGDIFFTLPAIYNLADASQSVTYAFSTRLTPFFKKHLTKINVEDVNTINRDNYNTVIELGNYPLFDKSYDQIQYITGKKVKQHSIQHHIDGLARLNKNISNKYKGFPYFKRKTNTTKPYYTLHAGAGFLLKIWPTKNYAQLIEEIYNIFPNLECKIILGKEDPNPADYFTKKYNHIQYITGDLLEVGKAMEEASFHLGNDAGITHVAGAYNVPSIGIYGPTGPGSWGIYAQQNEILWGKPGNCALKCNYDVIINCKDRVCLSSISVKNVMASLYKLLQKNEEFKEKSLILNPNAVFDLTEKDCLISWSSNEILLEFKNKEMATFMKNLLSKPYHKNYNFNNNEIVNFLQSQELLFLIPTKFLG